MSKKTVKQSDLKTIAKTIKKAPVADRQISRREAITTIKKDILQLRKKGYTLSEIAELLTTSGLAITPATLRTYVANQRNEGEKKIYPQQTKQVEKVTLENSKEVLKTADKQTNEVQQKTGNNRINHSTKGHFPVMDDIIL